MGLDNAAKMTFKGRYSTGCGKASKVCATPKRQAQFKELFGCNLTGTFNVILDDDCTHIYPTIKKEIHSYYFVKIILSATDYTYGWAYRWKGTNIQDNKVEIYTKDLIPDRYKNDKLTIQFLQKISTKEILDWQQDKYWFQSFPWLESKYKRADSEMVWNHINTEDYANKTVLDFGCHYGYYSMQAARVGAIVHGIDKKVEDIRIATYINDNIELTDATFQQWDKIPDNKYDYIFELSVFHWINETYSHLEQHITELKSKCKTLYLELINPPLNGGLQITDVDRIVGGEKLVHYQHKVRKTRTLYRVKGDL